MLLWFLKNGRYLVTKIYRPDPSVYQSGSGTPKLMPHRTKDTVYADNGCVPSCCQLPMNLHLKGQLNSVLLRLQINFVVSIFRYLIDPFQVRYILSSEASQATFYICTWEWDMAYRMGVTAITIL